MTNKEGANTKREMTTEIGVREWKQGEIRLKMWDLPGQPELYVSHHFFLTVGSRGVYVVVIRAIDEVEMIRGQLYHWFSVLKAHHTPQYSTALTKIAQSGPFFLWPPTWIR